MLSGFLCMPERPCMPEPWAIMLLLLYLPWRVLLMVSGAAPRMPLLMALC